MTHPRCAAALIAALLLTGCGVDDPSLMNFRASRTGPDEFLVAPVKPLVPPPNPAELPPPTRGATNLADPTPEADAIVALGGRPQAATGVPAGDGGLVRYAGRLGTDPAIRQTTAAEDLEFRRRNPGRLLERLTNANVYYRSYGRQSLDQQSEIDRFRRAGVPTPAAPPHELFPD